MSAKHAVISCEGGDDGPESYKVTITDHSRHGVMINKEKIPEGKPVPLRHGDVVTLPFNMDYVFKTRGDDGCKPITPPPAEPKSAKKTPGKKRAADSKSAGKQREETRAPWRRGGG